MVRALKGRNTIEVTLSVNTALVTVTHLCQLAYDTICSCVFYETKGVKAWIPQLGVYV